MQKAKELENEDSDNIRFSIMDLYTASGDDKNNDFFVKQKDNFTGFESIGFINNYGLFLKHCTKDETVLSGATILKTYTEKGKNAYVKYSAQKALKDLMRMYQDKEDELTSKLEDIKKQNGDATAVNNQLTTVMATKTKLKELYDSSKS